MLGAGFFDAISVDVLFVAWFFRGSAFYDVAVNVFMVFHNTPLVPFFLWLRIGVGYIKKTGGTHRMSASCFVGFLVFYFWAALVFSSTQRRDAILTRYPL